MEKLWELKDNELHLYKKGVVRIWDKDMVMFAQGFIYCKDVMMNIPSAGVVTGGQLNVNSVIVHGVNYFDLSAGNAEGWVDDKNVDQYTRMWGYKGF